MIGPLRPLAEVDLNSILLANRFAVEQWRGDTRKIRVIDNFKDNEANDFAVAWETTTNDREDEVSEAVLRMKKRLFKAGLDPTVLVGLEDFVGAYKTIAPCEDQRWLMHALVWDTDSDQWKVGELLTMPFGALGGVLAWWRCATAQRTIARRLFEIIVFYYVDDTHIIEPAVSAHETKAIFQEIMSLLGWELDADKSVPMGTDVVSLGCRLRIYRDRVVWSLPADKATTWQQSIQDVLSRGVITEAEAAKLQGRLNFGGSRVFKRIGRAKLRPLAHVAAGHGVTAVAGRLRNALQWWNRYVGSCPRHTTTLEQHGRPQADWLLYTDAEGNGNIGIVLVHIKSRRVEYATAKVPRETRRRLLYRKTQINLYELLAVASAISTFGDWIRGQRVVAFIDNQAALNMIIKGWSRAEDANVHIDYIWNQVATLDACIHWSYVRSKSNIADGPSRRKLNEMAALLATARPASWGVRHED
jgi:hypothetical protein